MCIKPQGAPVVEAYRFCRASAWLDALRHASDSLSADSERRLWEMDWTNETARQALAAMLFPVSTSTPDISASPEVRVYLSSEAPRYVSTIFARPEKLLLEMALLDETRFMLEEMRQILAHSLVAGEAASPGGSEEDSLAQCEGASSRLAELADALDALWLLASTRHENNSEAFDFASPLFLEAAGRSSLPAPLLLARAMEALDAQMPQAAQNFATKALEAIEGRQSHAGAETEAWAMLLAWGHYLRGTAQARLNQDALASNDLDKAAKLLDGVGWESPLLTSISLARAGLLRQRGQFSEMCAQLEKACALGACGELATARRQGQCVKKEDAQ